MRCAAHVRFEHEISAVAIVDLIKIEEIVRSLQLLARRIFRFCVRPNVAERIRI
jgi:hypothetical protein